MKVGFIGLGQMGQGMARCLLDAGHNLTVWNRDRSKAGELETIGATMAATPRKAAQADVVFTMLANDGALEAVSFGNDGILAIDNGVTHVSCSTVSVALTRRLTKEHEDAKQGFISAPVFGGPDAAAAGQLVIMTAGPRGLRDQCEGLFRAISEKILPMGEEPAMAAAAKLAANFSIAAVIENITEAFAIAGSGGVPPEALLKLYEEVNFGTRLISVSGRLIASFRQSNELDGPLADARTAASRADIKAG